MKEGCGVNPADLVAATKEASRRIHGFVRKTPLEHSPVLSKSGSANVYIKLENEQITGSFKARGAFNKVRHLLEQPGSTIKEKGTTTASSGNHALACNYAMQKHGIQGTTFVPEVVTPVKANALKAMGANLKYFGADGVEAEAKARQNAKEEGAEYISPYNDFDVMAGQGAIGMEILADLPEVDAVFVPVGGGGLIAGVAAYMKSVKPNIKIIGCQPELSKVMYESVKAGHVVFEESGNTLSDGTCGGIEEPSLTFDICRDLVDEWVLVSEEDISPAVYFMMEHHHKIVEGSGVLPLAAYLKTEKQFRKQNVVLVVSGGNISMSKIRQIVNTHCPPTLG